MSRQTTIKWNEFSKRRRIGQATIEVNDESSTNDNKRNKDRSINDNKEKDDKLKTDIKMKCRQTEIKKRRYAYDQKKNKETTNKRER